MKFLTQCVIATYLALSAACASQLSSESNAITGEAKTKDAVIEAILKAPQWDYNAFEAGGGSELLKVLFRLGAFSDEDLRAIVAELMRLPGGSPTRNQWFKVYVINRLVFDIPPEATWRDAKGAPGGFGLPPGIESATWPVLFRADNKVAISSRSAGYSGPDYQGLKEYDYFASKYGRRDLSKLLICDDVSPKVNDWLFDN